jgi:hypothetical protein
MPDDVTAFIRPVAERFTLYELQRIAASNPKPDQACLARGDSYGELQRRCYVAAGLSDVAVGRRVLSAHGFDTVPDLPRTPDDIAVDLADVAAWSGLAAGEIAHILGWLSANLPGFPDDPDELAAIVRAALP